MKPAKRIENIPPYCPGSEVDDKGYANQGQAEPGPDKGKSGTGPGHDRPQAGHDITPFGQHSAFQGYAGCRPYSGQIGPLDRQTPGKGCQGGKVGMRSVSPASQSPGMPKNFSSWSRRLW